jgi:hypothetical protein
MGKSWIIVGFIIVLAISSLVLIIEYQPIYNTQQNLAESWMFKGAYATYEGQIDSLSIQYSLNETIQVTDLNATHVQIQTNSSIATSFAPKFSDQTTVWINKTNINFQPEGETLAGTYNTKITVRNIGSRDCIAYDYTNQAINATYYIDKVLLWPVRIVYTTTFENQTYQIEFNLKSTNINGLS